MIESLRVRTVGWVVGVLVVCTSAFPAQEAQHEHHHPSPYGDQEDSGIASLSLREMEQLENGEGMGLARAAELNGYPGPMHVLELSTELELTADQKPEIEKIHDRMRAEARRLGAEIVERERTLNRRFDHRHVDESSVRALTAEIASLYGELRFAHLRAHLETAAVLTRGQIAAYGRLRGYAAVDPESSR